jgi:putative transposase
MAQTFSRLLVHVVFSTKDRTASLKADIRTDLFAYMGGIIQNFGGQSVLINGVADHVHLLFSIPATMAMAESMKIIKAKSSRWMRGRDRSFTWQPGYAAFSVSQSSVGQVTKYIASQQEHHKRVQFEDEFFSLLKKYEMVYDEQYVWA